MQARDALPRDPAWHVSKLVFGFLPWPLRRVKGIWHLFALIILFALIHMPRRIARERVLERVPTIEKSRFVTCPLYPRLKQTRSVCLRAF